MHLDVHFETRLDALSRALPAMTTDDAQIVLFCSETTTADAIAAGLGGSLGVPVYRHRADDDDWLQFTEASASAVLVCDRQAEEELNLQGGRKVVVHYDLPLNPTGSSSGLEGQIATARATRFCRWRYYVWTTPSIGRGSNT